MKFLALYERDINLLVTRAARGVIVIDDVVTTGGTIMEEFISSTRLHN